MEIKLTGNYLRKVSGGCRYTEYINDKVRVGIIDSRLHPRWMGTHRDGYVYCGVHISEDASLEYMKNVVDAMKERGWIPQDWPLSLHRESKEGPLSDVFLWDDRDEDDEDDEDEKPKTINEQLMMSYWSKGEIMIALSDRTLDVVNDIINTLRLIPYDREDGISKTMLHIANLTGDEGNNEP